MVIAVDSSCLISAMNSAEPDCAAARALMEHVRNGDCKMLVSALVFGEVQSVGQIGQADLFLYFELLQNVRVAPATATVCQRAGELRRERGRGLKLPDAIHLATALAAPADILVTSDRQLAAAAKTLISVRTPKQLVESLA